MSEPDDAVANYLEQGCDCDPACPPGSPQLVRCLLAKLAGPPSNGQQGGKRNGG